MTSPVTDGAGLDDGASLDEIAAALVDDDFFAGDPHGALARLRRESPVHWCERRGYWAVTRHADVLAVSKDNATFVSRFGVLYRMLTDTPPEVPGSLLSADPPVHTHYRKILQPAFAPSRMRALEPRLRSLAAELLDALPEGEPVDWVDAVAVPFPLVVLAELMGLPAESWRRFHVWVDASVASGGRREGERPPEIEAHMAAMYAYLRDAYAEKRRAPDDGVISALVAHREPDGRELSDAELMMFIVQLFIAGNETTRNSLTGGLVAFAEHPEQWDRVVADPSVVTPATEEILRWTTAVINFFRVPVVDTEIGGQRIGAREPVCMSYTAANRDELEFGPSADRFDVTRDPNHHLAFGFGAHFCLGAALARLEIRVLLDELRARFSRIEPAGEVVRTPSHLIAGITRAPLVFHR